MGVRGELNVRHLLRSVPSFSLCPWKKYHIIHEIMRKIALVKAD